MTTRGPWEPPTPDQEAAVARLLSDAAGPVSMPPEVAARLDEVLTGLEAERAGETEAAVAGSSVAESAAPATSSVSSGASGPGEVVTLRTRRRWPRALLAAAAVVIGG